MSTDMLVDKIQYKVKFIEMNHSPLDPPSLEPGGVRF